MDCSLHLRLENFHRKIASVEAEISLVEGENMLFGLPPNYKQGYRKHVENSPGADVLRLGGHRAPPENSLSFRAGAGNLVEERQNQFALKFIF